MRLFSYKMTHDTGFAPNPYGEHLTLATCKPGIRYAAQVDDWVAGFTSKGLCGDDEVGRERLVYLMRVAEKIPLRDYYGDPRFQNKIPGAPTADIPPGTGDNIYRPVQQGAERAEDFEQLKNLHHDSGNIKKDISAKHPPYVLISREFYYFGKEAIDLPKDCRPPVPGRNYQITEGPQAQRFIEYVKSLYKPGRHGEPHAPPAGGGCGSIAKRC